MGSWKDSPAARGGAWVGFGLGWALVGCVDSGEFVCSNHDQCALADRMGTCEPIGYCSFPDGMCPSGRRYGDSAPGRVAGHCVDPEQSAGTTTLASTTDPTSTSTSTSTSASTSTSTSTSDPSTSSSTSAVTATATGSSSTSSTGLGTPCPTQSDAATVALYHLDSARIVADAVGGHDGFWREGAPILVAGPEGCGTAVEFEDTITGVIPDDAAFQLDEGSLDVWLRLPPPPPPPNTGQGIISRDAAASPVSGHFTLWYAPDGRIVARIQPESTMGSDRYVCSNGPVPQDQWMYVGVNFGPPDLELYLDGVQQEGDGTVILFGDDRGCGGGPTTVGIDGNFNPWVLGASAGATAEASPDPPEAFFTGGAIDELRLSSVRRPF